MKFDHFKYISNLYKECNKQPSMKDQNWLVGPVSILYSLLLAISGAEGETQDEMIKALGFELNTTSSSKKVDHVRYLIKQTIGNELEQDSSKGAIFLANLLCLNKTCMFNQDYLDKEIKLDDAKLLSLDCSNPANAAKEINEEVAQITEYLMKELVKPDSITEETFALLVNSMYFKSGWQDGFDAGKTESIKFKAATSEKDIPFMCKESSFYYCDFEESSRICLKAEGIRITFDNMMDLLIVVPKEGASLKEISDKLEGHENFEFICKFDNYNKKKLKLCLPRFEIEGNLGLDKILESMGIKKAFADEADFSVMTTSKVKISSVVHRAILKVNEDGAEGATGTSTESSWRALGNSESKEVIVDRPFFITIVSKQKHMPLFMGNVCDPTDPGKGEGIKTENSSLRKELEFKYFANLYKDYLKCHVAEANNWLVGPFSILMSIALAFDGAKGSTQDEIFKIFGFLFTNFSKDEQVFHALKESFLDEFERADVKDTVFSANMLCMSDNYFFKQDYLEKEKRRYKAIVERIDFLQESEAAKKINDKIAEATGNVIKELVKEENFFSNMRVILINTLYFKDAWLRSFDPALTTSMKFNEVGMLPFMNTEGYFLYSDFSDASKKIPAEGVRIKFKNSMSLVLVMPHEGTTLKEFNEKMENEKTFKCVCSRESYTLKKLKLSIPRFQLENAIEIKEVLEAMGIKKAFSDSADFSNMTKNKVKLSTGFSKAVLKINEDGAEGAAGTALLAQPRSLGVAKEVTFNRPFFVALLTHDHDLPLFMGNVCHPNDPGAGKGVVADAESKE